MKVPRAVRERVRGTIDRDAVVDLCSRLVQMNSIVENDAAEAEIASFVADYFRDLGLELRVVDLPDDLGVPDMGKGPHPTVVARLKGAGGGPVLMVGGHLDTEPVVDPHLWTHDPFSGHVDRENGFVYGLGTVNMKQSLASFMTAISAIVRSGIRLKGDLVFAATSQEDLGMIGARYLATHWDSLRIGKLPDMYLGGDQSDCAAWTCNVGLALFVITTYGRSAHCSSRYIHHPAYRDSYLINAADKMLKIMLGLKDVQRTFVYDRSTFLGDPSVCFGKIETKYAGGGGRAALGVHECRLYCDIRFPAGMSKRSCKRDIERMIYNLSVEDPDLRASVEVAPDIFGLECGPVIPPEDFPLLDALRGAHREVFGEELVVDTDTNGTTTHRTIDWTRMAASDVSAFHAAGIPGLNYGPGIVPVTPDERVSIEQLVKHCAASALTVLEICGVVQGKVQNKKFRRGT